MNHTTNIMKSLEAAECLVGGERTESVPTGLTPKDIKLIIQLSSAIPLLNTEGNKYIEMDLENFLYLTDHIYSSLVHPNQKSFFTGLISSRLIGSTRSQISRNASYHEIKKQLLTAFQPKIYLEDVQDELYNIIQKHTETLTEYRNRTYQLLVLYQKGLTHKFLDQAIVNALYEDEKMKAMYFFRRGLSNTDLSNRLACIEFNDFDTMFDRALKMERELLKDQHFYKHRESHIGVTCLEATVKCKFCDKNGHELENCCEMWELKKMNSIACDFCDKKRHALTMCPAVLAVKTDKNEIYTYCKRQGHSSEKFPIQQQQQHWSGDMEQVLTNVIAPTPTFSGKCFSCKTPGHMIRKCPGKATTRVLSTDMGAHKTSTEMAYKQIQIIKKRKLNLSKLSHHVIGYVK